MLFIRYNNLYMLNYESKTPEKSKQEEFNRIKNQSFLSAEDLLLKDDDGDYLGGNADLIDRLLVHGDHEQLQELLKYLHATNHVEVTIADVEFEAYYARMRNNVHEEMDWSRRTRDLASMPKSDFEEKAGILLEEIEPQVRQAVTNLNDKGYKTKGSGFYGNTSQQIYLSRDSKTGQADNAFSNYHPSDELAKWLETKNIELEVESDSITYTTKEKLNLAELEEIWNKIADDVPLNQN